MPPVGAQGPNETQRAFAPSPQGSQNGLSGVTPGGQYLDQGRGANVTAQQPDTASSPSLATGDGVVGQQTQAGLSAAQAVFNRPTDAPSPTAKKLFNDVPEDSHWEAGTPMGTTHGGQQANVPAGSSSANADSPMASTLSSMFSHTSPLAGKGQMLVDVANKYGIPADMFAAIVTHETGHGTSNALVNKNNPGGMMGGPGSMQLKGFDNLEQGLEAMAHNLRINYFDKGRTDAASIGQKYAPVGAENDPRGLNSSWVSGVSALQKQIQDRAGLVSR